MDSSSELPSLAEDAVDVDPAVGLRAVTAMRRLSEQLERQHVRRARKDGWTWQQIGDALGTTRQAAHKKHGG